MSRMQEIYFSKSSFWTLTRAGPQGAQGDEWSLWRTWLSDCGRFNSFICCGKYNLWWTHSTEKILTFQFVSIVLLSIILQVKSTVVTIMMLKEAVKVAAEVNIISCVVRSQGCCSRMSITPGEIHSLAFISMAVRVDWDVKSASTVSS